ncbi:hypothetical protein D3C81_1997810 [compost metagenome]
MPTSFGRQQTEQGVVVVLAGNAAAVVLGIEVAGVDRQGPVTQGLGVLQAVETLLVDVFQLRLP